MKKCFSISVFTGSRFHGASSSGSCCCTHKRSHHFWNRDNQCRISLQSIVEYIPGTCQWSVCIFFDIECAKNNSDTHLELVRDGAKTGVQAYCHGTGDYDNSSTLGVLHLSTGDTVWVRLYGSDNITFGGKTLFSGFLL